MIATKIKCQVSHISQVLNGSKSQLTLEQAEGLNEFFGHTPEESFYFLLLVQYSRAGTPALKSRMKNQILELQEKRSILKDRFQIKSLSREHQIEFYSSWLYGAVHVLLTIPEYQSKEKISRYLEISLKKITHILQFLVSIGLAEQVGTNLYKVGRERIHLGSDSPLISKFHTNWRMKAIQAMDQESFSTNLHYSSVISLSAEDFSKLKSQLINMIEEAKKIIRESPAEELGVFNVDFFKMK